MSHPTEQGQIRNWKGKKSEGQSLSWREAGCLILHWLPPFTGRAHKVWRWEDEPAIDFVDILRSSSLR